MSKFQVKLGRHWQDYEHKEDKKLKTAYMCGQRTARFNMFINGKKEKYEVNFKQMTQENLISGGSREIRAPYRMEAPGGPIRDADDKPMEPGPTICIKVPEGTAGTVIKVPHPKAKGQFFEVKVPADAKPGQAMLVPVPSWEGRLDPVREQFKKWDKDGKGYISFGELAELIAQLNPELSRSEINDLILQVDKNQDYKISYDEFATFLEMGKGGGSDPKPAAGGGEDPAAPGTEKKGWSTGKKVAVGAAAVGGVAVIGAACVAGALLAEGDGLEDLGDSIGDLAGDAGDAIGDVAGDVGDWLAGATEDAGDFIMDLF